MVTHSIHYMCVCHGYVNCAVFFYHDAFLHFIYIPVHVHVHLMFNFFLFYRYVLGHEAMKKMSASNVLIAGMKGLGVEVGKYSIR